MTHDATQHDAPDQLGGITHNHTQPCPSGRPYPHPYNIRCRPGEPATTASSVPPVARGRLGSLADVHAVRGVLSPLRAVGPVTSPSRGEDGPYETEREARLARMPIAVAELHDAGLVDAGDPGRLTRNTVLAHLEAACEAARLDLGAYEHRVLEWLAGGETNTAQVVIGLIRRAHAAGLAAGRIASGR
jgi:hypothetical protein